MLILTLILFLATSTGIFAEFNIVSFPQMADLLGTSIHQVQMSIGVYMIAVAFSGLVIGPLSDKFGRRIPLLIGCSIATLSSALLALANSITWVLILRFVQGAAISTGTIICRGWIRDQYSGQELRRISALMSMAGPLVISFTPSIGSFIFHFYPSVSLLFWVMTGLLFIMTLITFYIFPDSTIKTATNNNDGMFKQFKNILFHRTFYRNLIIFCFSIFNIVCYVTISPIILQTNLNLDAYSFGLTQITLGTAWIIGAMSNFLLVKKFSPNTCIRIGTALSLSGFILMLILFYSNLPVWISIIAPMVLVYSSITLCCSNSFVNMIMPFPSHGATAGALINFVQFLLSALGAAIISYLPETTHFPMTMICLGSALLLFLTSLVLPDKAKQDN